MRRKPRDEKETHLATVEGLRRNAVNERERGATSGWKGVKIEDYLE